MLFALCETWKFLKLSSIFDDFQVGIRELARVQGENLVEAVVFLL